MTIQLTVGLPLFRAKYIAWLALEGLIRQKGINFEWEIVIIEETNNSEVFGIDRINEYRERLEDVGCVNINYQSLDNWIPMAEKFKLMGEEVKGKIYAGNADDYYPSPYRLKSHYDALIHGKYDLFLPRRVIYYSIAEDIAYMRNMDKSHRVDDVEGRAVRAEFMRGLDPKGRKKGCDKWMHMSFITKARHKYNRQIRIIKDESDNWKYGLSTFGFNNISIDRIVEWGNDSDKTLWPKENMEKYIPIEVLERLRDSKKNIKHHKRKLGD